MPFRLKVYENIRLFYEQSGEVARGLRLNTRVLLMQKETLLITYSGYKLTCLCSIRTLPETSLLFQFNGFTNSMMCAILLAPADNNSPGIRCSEWGLLLKPVSKAGQMQGRRD